MIVLEGFCSCTALLGVQDQVCSLHLFQHPTLSTIGFILGVGSAIIEQLREDYPLSYILTITVAPFSHGETPLQHYNSLLCLHHLQTQADGVILFQNDHILAQTLKSIGIAPKPSPATFKPARAVASSASSVTSGGVSVDDMNRHMSSTICNTLLPVWSAKQKLVNV